VPGGEPYIVLSYRTWEREFGSDHQIVGKTVRVNGALLTIIGVAPPGFEGLWRGVSVGLWVPLTMDSVIHMNDPMAERSTYWLMAVGRLRPGTSLQQLRAELSTVAGRLAVAYPKTNKGRSARALPLNQVTIMPAIDKTLRAGSLVLLGFVGLVLLLTCANLAGTLLARGATRRREIALRTALGAGRVRLIRQLLTENLLLSLLGGALALLLPALLNVILPRVLESLSLAVPLTFSLRPGVDVRVLGFTLTVVMATTFLFGLLPAIKSSQVTLASSLNESPDTATGSRKKYRTLNVLVVGQTAVSLVLMICAALSLRSVWNASRIDPGFDPAGIVTASFLPSRIDYSSSETKRFYRQIVDRLRVLPGVLSTGLADKLPLTLGYATAQCAAEGRDSAPEEQWLTVDRASVGPGYFETMRIPILRGRAFNEQDSDTSGSVAIVNQTLASLLWPGQDPIAQRLRLGGSKGYFEVVGVARDGKYRTLGEQHRPYVYLDLQQSPETDAILVVRTAGDPRALLGPIREVSRGIDPRVPMTDLESLKQKISVSLLLPRLAGEVFGLFGLLGLVLACVGLYGVVAYTVSQHTHEIGVRLALGAERGDISRSVIGRGLSPVLLGVVLGLAGASGVTRLLATILYGVSATDPLTIAGVTLLLLSVALAACYIPAWRATRVEPLVALRYE
jgi:predicted permease